MLIAPAAWKRRLLPRAAHHPLPRWMRLHDYPLLWHRPCAWDCRPPCTAWPCHHTDEWLLCVQDGSGRRCWSAPTCLSRAACAPWLGRRHCRLLRPQRAEGSLAQHSVTCNLPTDTIIALTSRPSPRHCITPPRPSPARAPRRAARECPSVQQCARRSQRWPAHCPPPARPACAAAAPEQSEMHRARKRGVMYRRRGCASVHARKGSLLLHHALGELPGRRGPERRAVDRHWRSDARECAHSTGTRHAGIASIRTHAHSTSMHKRA